MYDPYIEVTSRLESDGHGWFCPGHDDQNPSLSVSRGADGRVLLKDHRNPSCTALEIVSAIGLTLRDLFPRSGSRLPAVTPSPLPRGRVAAPKPRPVIVDKEPYKLCDADGRFVIEQVRLNHKDGGKHFAYRDELGCWVKPNGIGLSAADYPLYRSEQLRKHPDKIVVITEGAKAAHAVIRADVHKLFVVLASVAGAEVTPSQDRLKCLRGRTVWLWPDNDEAGRDQMRNVAFFAPAREIAMIVIDGLPAGGDADDFFKAGGTILQMLERVGR
jgi:hypothetical protein